MQQNQQNGYDFKALKQSITRKNHQKPYILHLFFSQHLCWKQTAHSSNMAAEPLKTFASAVADAARRVDTLGLSKDMGPKRWLQCMALMMIVEEKIDGALCLYNVNHVNYHEISGADPCWS